MIGILDYLEWARLMKDQPKHPVWRLWKLPEYWRARAAWIARVEAFRARQEDKP